MHQYEVKKPQKWKFLNALQFQSDTESDDDNEIQETAIQLFQAYTKYQSYLFKILEEEGQILKTGNFEPQHEKLNRLNNYKEECMKKKQKKKDKRKGRQFVVQKLMGKFRKNYEEERKLKQKYEIAEMEKCLKHDLIGTKRWPSGIARQKNGEYDLTEELKKNDKIIGNLSIENFLAFGSKKTILDNIIEIPEKKKNSIFSSNLTLSANDAVNQKQENFSIPSINILNPGENIAHVNHDETLSQNNHISFSKGNVEFDTFSQKPHKNSYIEQQKQKLERQRNQTRLLKMKVSEVLEEGKSLSEPRYLENNMKRKSQLENVDSKSYLAKKSSHNFRVSWCSNQIAEQSFKYIFEQLCQLWALVDYLKFSLKNKEYSILQILCHQEIGTGPITIKSIKIGISSLLKKQEEWKIAQVVERIFGNDPSIFFQDFRHCLKSTLNQQQARHVSTKVVPIHSYALNQALSRLFMAFLQILYFEAKIKDLLINIEGVIEKLVHQTNKGLLDISRMEYFIYETQGNRVNRLKVNIFFRNNLQGLQLWEFIQWINKDM